MRVYVYGGKMRKMKSSGVEWIGEIPEDWGIVKVKQAFVRKNEKAKQENPVILSLARTGVKVRDVSTNEGQVAESYYNYNPVSVGDLLLNPMDLYSGANCSLSEVEGVISPAYVNLKNKEGYFSKFYDYYFKVQYWMMVLFAHGKGVSFDNRWTLNHETLMNFPIVSPDFKTQKHIADFLDDKCGKIDRYIEKQQKIIDKLKEYKQVVITEAVRFRDGWTSCHLGYLAQFKNGLNYSGLSTDVEIKFLGVGDFQNHFMLNSKEMFSTLKFDGNMPEDLLLKNGDIVFVRSNGSKDLVGRSVLIDNVDYPLTYSGFCIRMRNIRQDIIQNKFLLYRFWSNEFRQSLNQDSRGSNINNLNQELLSKFAAAFPVIDEQKKIVKYLDAKCFEIDSAISKQTSIIEKLTEYKKSLIYEVVTGKLEV